MRAFRGGAVDVGPRRLGRARERGDVLGRVVKNLGLYLVLILLVVSMVNVFMTPEEAQKQYSEISYSSFLTELEGGRIRILQIRNNTLPGESSSAVLRGELKDGKRFLTYGVDVSGLADRASRAGVVVTVEAPQKTSWWMSMLSSLVPTLLLVGVWVFFLYNMQGGGGKVVSFAKSKAKLFLDNRPKVTFADVAGCEESKEELQEVVQFLKSPEKFTRLGAKVPRGVLLLGPPGTGKTLLARAAAGEANVPFFSVSGSDFVEMFVGVGAARVRDLFEQAKKYQPCLIFIDEMDAVGRHRGAGLGGGHDEREQTLNQLLVELDGFDDTSSTILIAATNRPDILDPALLRPGRFDRQIAVEAPDIKGREAILKVHAQGKPLTAQVDLRQIAKRTPGFTGADLANVLNEAALLTARSNMQFIDDRAIDEAIDRVIAGPQKRTRVMNDHDKAVTAYHEGGHALAAAALNYTDPVTKVTILPRGRALGYTMVMPTEDRFNKTRNQLLDDLVYSMGGRVAEEIVFRDPSTGPANDIQQATKTARAMVTDYGMSDRIGMVKLGDADTEAFGHGSGEGPRAFSDETAAIIDEEVRRLLDNAMREAWEILTNNRAILDTLAARLLEEETLDEAQLAQIFKDVVKAPERPVWNYQADAAVPGARLGNPVGIKAEDEWKPVPVQGIDVSPTDVIGASGVEEEQE